MFFQGDVDGLRESTFRSGLVRDFSGQFRKKFLTKLGVKLFRLPYDNQSHCQHHFKGSREGRQICYSGMWEASHCGIGAFARRYSGKPLLARRAFEAKKIHRDKSTVTTLVGKLAASGYVKRVKNLKDRRITYIYLSEKGKALQPDFYEISQKFIEQIYKGFSELEQEMVVRLLERMLENW